MVFQPRRTWEQPSRKPAPRRDWSEGSVTFAPGRGGADGHRCSVGSFDYSKADVEDVYKRSITCVDCGRVWKLKLTFHKETGKVTWAEWWPDICPGCGFEADRCRHYGRRNSSKKKVSDDA